MSSRHTRETLARTGCDRRSRRTEPEEPSILFVLGRLQKNSFTRNIRGIVDLNQGLQGHEAEDAGLVGRVHQSSRERALALGWMPPTQKPPGSLFARLVRRFGPFCLTTSNVTGLPLRNGVVHLRQEKTRKPQRTHR